MNALACYGVPSVFSFKEGSWCLGCEHFNECRVASWDALKETPLSSAVNAALIEHERFDAYKKATAAFKAGARITRAKQLKLELSPAQTQMIGSQPAGVGKVLRLLYQQGMDAAIRKVIASHDLDLSGVKAHRSLLLALEILMRRGFTKKDLKCAFVNYLGWSERSAWSQASLTWTLLIALGVAVEFLDRLLVAPNLSNENRWYELYFLKGNHGDH